MIRAGRVMKQVVRTGLDDLQKRVLPAFTEFARKARAKKLAELPDEAVLAEIAEREKVALNEFGPELLKPGFLAAYYHGRLAGTLEMVLGATEGRALTRSCSPASRATRRSSRTSRSIGVGQGRDDARRVPRRVRPPRRERARTGRAALVGGSRLPEAARRAVRKASGGASPVELHHKKKHERQEAELTIGKLLWRTAPRRSRPTSARTSSGAQRHMPWRETCKHSFILGVALVREAVEVLAERWDLGKDIYYLKREELFAFKGRRSELHRADPGTEGEVERVAAAADAGDPLLARSPGARPRRGAPRVAGRHLHGNRRRDGHRHGHGPDPPFALRSGRPELGLRAGLSHDRSELDAALRARGGARRRARRHAVARAIVARDFGIPAVVLPGATKTIPEGATVRIDGNKGRVEIQK
jgi:hypothetical protein